jgi:hypothetical protein
MSDDSGTGVLREPRIEPPESSGWQVQTRWGLLRHNNTSDGRLVRLADVVRWLMETRELPLSEAVGQVCAALEGEVPPLVYRINASGWATPENSPSAWFAVLPDCEKAGLAGLPLAVAHARNTAWHLRAECLITQHDLERLTGGEYDASKETPFEFNDRTDAGGIASVAVDFAAAYACWGWGAVAVPDAAPAQAPALLQVDDVKNIETLARYRAQFVGLPAQRRPAWLPKHVAIARAEVETRGKGGNAAVAKQLGMSASGLYDLFKRHPEPGADNANPWAGLNKAA